MVARPSPFVDDVVRGKVAVITGSGSGIGYEISVQLGKHGAAVAIMGRRKAVLDSAVSALRGLGISAAGFEGDVRKQDDARRVVESTFQHFGRIDVLVNAAAGNFLVSAEDLSPNGFKTGVRVRPHSSKALMDIDSVGTFTTCHEDLNYLKKGGRSGKGPLGRRRHDPKYQCYFALHGIVAAVDALTRNLALEWGTDYDIRVNGVAPGTIGDTTGMDKLVPKEISSKAREYMPLYKLGEKWDIAMTILFLASNAGKYINGTTLVVDGGLWLSGPRHLPKEAVKQLSRAVEKRSREALVGVPRSKI